MAAVLAVPPAPGDPTAAICRDERMRMQVRQAGTAMRAVMAYVLATSLIFIPGAGVGPYAAWAMAVLLAQWLRQRYAERLVRQRLRLDARDEWRLGVAMLVGDAPVYLAAPLFVASLAFEARMYYTVLHFGLVVCSVYFVGLNPRVFPLYVLMGLGILTTGGWLFPSLPTVLITLVTHTAIGVFLVSYSVRLSKTFDESVALRLEREQLVRQLTQAVEEAGRAQRSRSRLLAAASHDLLQPVNTMLLLVELLREEPQAQVQASALMRLAQAGRSIDSMFRGLLDMARLDADALRAASRPVDLDPLVETVCGPLESVCAEAGLQLDWPRNTRLRALADPVLLERCLRNVLDNAVKYSRRGGLIQVRLHRDSGEGSVRIDVEDAGPGIGERERELVFEDFFRGEAAASTTGVGLGLSITRQLLGLMQGRIELQSREGEGTTVHLFVPGLDEPMKG